MAAESKDKTTPRVRIAYFPAPGRAAPLRLALATAAIPFEDEFVAGPPHEELKKSGKLNWGTQMPHMTIYDEKGQAVTTMGQSNACLLYVGALAGLLPKPENALDNAKVVEIICAVEDWLGMTGAAFFEKDENKKKEMFTDLKENPAKWPLWWSQFERKLGDKPYFIGDDMTVADLKIFVPIAMMNAGMFPCVEKDYMSKASKKLQALYERIRALPRIKAFHDEVVKKFEEFKAGKLKDNVAKWVVGEDGNLTVA